MNAEFRRVKEIFLAAVEKPDPAERNAYVHETCGQDEELRRQVDALLGKHAQAGSFLETPAARPAVTVAEAPVLEQPGTVIGPYKLLQQIGEGGMGTVYMAEQSRPVQRKVAVKVIKPGMDSRQVIARFEAERQALAIMDHVNIARVFDGGTTESGRPYFAMELVHGMPITKYCDDNRLTPRERLELFVPVCQAIQHAHQKGIIHRDIKSSNVMVTLYDGKPVPKVIDFGVAKATEQKLTERTLFTQYGTMVGTLEYMSPEQAEMSALGVDTRSDIYSLGVLLYELLTGSTPLSHKRVKEAAYAEILRLIKEEEPQKPSTRLSDSGEALASISANRHMEPAKLTRLVRGELDWIVMKTLEKDRNRRYETAKDFACDMQRYLADEPVHACPPSALYRMRKYARRHKAGLLAAVFILFAVVSAGVGLGWLAREHASRTERTVSEARAAWTDVERLRQEGKWAAAGSVARRTEALLNVAGADPELQRKFTELCRDLEMAARLEEVRAHEPIHQSGRFDWTRLSPNFAQAFRDYGIDVETLATAETAERIGGRTISEELVEALDDWTTLRWKTDKNAARRLLAVARAADQDPARNRLREAFERGDRAYLKELAGSDQIDRFPPSTVILLVFALARTDGSETALTVLRKAQGQHPDHVWINLALAEILAAEPATKAEAIGFYRAALACRPDSVAIHIILGNILQEQGQARQAAEAFRRATQLKPDSPWAHLLLGAALVRLDKLPEALTAFRRAVQLKPRDPPAAPDRDWFREPERLVELDDQLPGIIRGEYQPRDAVERAEFALACQFRELHAASARLFEEAFAAQPDLTQPHRYHAAWAAVLAGTGKGKDAGGLREREKERLRGRARIWLRGELDAWRQCLEKEQAASCAEVLDRINCWLTDADLVCVRDAESLGRLPQPERGEWEELWRDLRALRASARSMK
jgi:serine/threonine protein kinase/tetratricopeptide (TPR) repeat protein